MDTDRWKAIDELFEEMVSLGAGDRATFIDRVCVEDPSLRVELESLLASHSESEKFLEAPAVEQVAESVVASSGKDLASGQTIGQYRVISELGKGGQGAVFKAFDTKLNRTVALKTLPPDLSIDNTARKRFEREAQLASALDHPNICTVHDLTVVDGTHFIVLQYVDGKNVRQLVNGRPLELKSG